MANVKPYDQGQLASEVVGTPGVDRSAGAAESTLARGASEVLANENALRQSGAGTLASLGTAAAVLLGRGYAHMQKLKQHQQNLLDDAQLADDIMQFKNDTRGRQRGDQDAFKNDPQLGRETFDEYFNNELGRLKEKYSSNPRLRAKLAESMQSYAPEQLDHMDDWARTRRTVITQKNAKNFVDDSIQRVADLAASDSDTDGGIESRLLSAQAELKATREYLEQKSGTLGEEQADALYQDYKAKVGSALFESYLSNRPEEPEAGLKYVKDTKAILEAHVDLGITLTAGQKKTLHNEIEGLADKYAQVWSNRVKLDEMDSTLINDGIRVFLNAHRDDKLVQQQMIGKGQKMVAMVRTNAQRIISDPNVPDKVKVVVKQQEHTTVTQINSIMNDAYAHIHAKNAEEKALQREKERNAKEAARDARSALHHEQDAARLEIETLHTDLERLAVTGDKTKLAEASTKFQTRVNELASKGLLAPGLAGSKSRSAITLVDATTRRVAKEELAKDQTDAKAKLNNLVVSLQTLALDPERNREQIDKTASQLFYHTKLMQEAGLVDPDYARAKQSAAMSISGAANQMYAANFLGIQTGGLKKVAEKDRLGKRNEAVQTMLDGVRQLEQQRKQENTADAAALPEAKRAKYYSLLNQINAVAKAKGWSAEQLRIQSVNALNRIIRE